MDVLAYFFNGLIAVLEPMNIVMMFVGLFLGVVGGMLPGINSVSTLALFVPFTFTMPPAMALISLGAIYMGSMYGGSIASVLINTPGQASAIATAMEGYPMTLKGEGKKALDTSLIASAYGGVFGGVLLLLFFEPLSSAGLKFGSEAFFWMGLFGLSALATLFPGNVIKSLLAGFIGMAISTVGMDQTAGLPRFTGGFPDLIQGLDLVVVMIGIFSISQMLVVMESQDEMLVAEKGKDVSLWRTTCNVLRHFRMVNLCALLGTFIGMLPGTGGTVASIIAYNEARRFSKRSSEFGTGIEEGIIAPESANNGSVGGALVPLLSLGIPGSASAAVIVGGLMAQGITPGPQLLEKAPDVAYAFIISIIICAIAMIPVGWIVSRGCVRVLDLPCKFIIPVVITLSCVGSYALRNSLFDVGVMLLTGAGAYVCMKAKVQPASMALGLVLGPIVEENLITTMMRAKDTSELFSLLFVSPLSVFFILCCVGVLLLPVILQRIQSRRNNVAHPPMQFNAEAIRRPDFWLMIFFTVCSVPFLLTSLSFPAESCLYPFFVYASIIVLSVLVMLLMLFEKTPEPAKHGVSALRYVQIAVCMALCIGFYYLIPVTGFYTAMFLMMAAVVVYISFINHERLDARQYAIIFGASGVTVLVEWLCFSLLLQVEPPVGLLF